MKPTSLRPVVSVFLLFIFLLLAWSAVGAVGFFNALVSKGWPTTVGKVVSSRVVSPSGKATKYIADISYTYTVDGIDYTSDNYMATAARGDSQWAREIVGQHPVGSEVTVHYNPKKPAAAIAEPGLQSDNYIMTFAPLFFVVVLIIGLVKQIKDNGKPVESTMTVPQSIQS